MVCESVDADLCALFYAILYKGLEHPWILVWGAGFLESIPLRYQRRTVVKFWGVNSYMQIFGCAVVGSGVLVHGVSNHCITQGQLYIICILFLFHIIEKPRESPFSIIFFWGNTIYI